MIVSIDTETGGFDPENDALLSISLVTKVGDQLNWVDFYINQKVKIVEKGKRTFIDRILNRKLVNKTALEVNKINPDDLKTKGVSLKVADTRIVESLESLERLGNHLTYLGQNLKFDLEFIRCNLPRTYKKIMKARRHIELTTASEIYHASISKVELSNSLDSMRVEFGINPDGAHSSIKDAKDALTIYELIKLKVGM